MMKVGLDESGHVITEPFDSLDEVLQWNPDSFSFNKSLLLQEQNWVLTNNSLIKGIEPASRPQMLICHDMCGGYLDDRFCQGCCAVSPYCFYHWQMIDTFVYFSHHFITIPPVGWIKAAHKHNVSILGTIITEWDNGASICQEMLQSETLIEIVTTKLAQMALAFGFDGWLINIENEVEVDQIPRLQYFVQDLTSKCRAMLDAPKVLWYDSVVNSGELKWQNELNANNEMFFQVCDGIFLNYCITKENLANSRQLASKYKRQFDVYVGVDAFGRGTPGGGGFNCKEVVKMIQDESLSCALFAPGWTYEKHSKENFDSQETVFWGLLCDILSTRTVPVPFTTSFCQGFGEKYFLEGQSLCESPWFNLTSQQIQPTFTQSQFQAYTLTKTVTSVTDETGAVKNEIRVDVQCSTRHPADPKMSFDVTCGYTGGGCLKLSAKKIKSQTVCFKLFKLESDSTASLKVSVVWKTSSADGVGLSLVLSSADGEKVGQAGAVLEVTNLSDKLQECVNMTEADPMICLESVKPTVETKIKHDFTHSTFVVNTAKFAQNAGYRDHLFILSAVLVPLDGQTTSSDSLMVAHLGQIAVCEYSSFVLPPPSVTKIWCWNLKADLPLSPEDLQKILINPLLNLNSQSLIDNAADATSSISIKPIIKSLGSFSTTSSLTQSSDLSALMVSSPSNSGNPGQLYILKWMCSRLVNVDYILVSSYDQSGSRKLLGHTVGESFVCSSFGDDYIPLCFSIQPIISSSNTPAEEMFYTL